jgi:phosphate-selective porin OprO/OprP
MNRCKFHPRAPRQALAAAALALGLGAPGGLAWAQQAEQAGAHPAHHAQPAQPAASAADAAAPAEPPWRFDFGVRMQVDRDSFDGIYSDDGEDVAVTYLRRLRLEFEARAFEVWRFKLDIAPDEEDVAILDSAVVSYHGFDALVFSAGRFKPDFGLEHATSSKWVTGIERSAVWDLAPDAVEREGSWGLELRHAGAHHHASVGWFNKPDGRAQVLRAVYAPLLQPGRVLHLGAAFSREDIDTSNGRIRTRLAVRGVSETDEGHRVTLADKLKNGFDSDHAGVLEFAFVHGPFSLQAEALQRKLGGAGGQSDRTARGQYLQLAWTLTGEARPYDIEGAKFKELRPTGKYGAWEVFYRHDRLEVNGGPDLLDDGASQTRARVDVLGLNWYASRRLKLSLNQLWAHTDGPVNDAGDDRGRALSLRLQVLF